MVLEPSSALDLNFKPLGKLVGGQDVQKAFARLANADIYYTFVEQKRKGVKYLPMVHYDGWPVATQKREKTPSPFDSARFRWSSTTGPTRWSYWNSKAATC